MTNSVAGWLSEANLVLDSVGTAFVPSTFEAYVTVLHPAYIGGGADRRLVRWSTIAERNQAELDRSTAWTDITGPQFLHSGLRQRGLWDSEPVEGCVPPEILPLLVSGLGDPLEGSSMVAVWEGYGPAITAAVSTPSRERLVLPNREYQVFPATTHLVAELGQARCGPNLWWASDHSWCVGVEVDAMCTVVGASSAVVDRIASSPHLEALVWT